MRKLIALLLALTMVLSFALVAYADGDTVLTTSVPDANYELVIPANQTIEYGTENKKLGTVTVENASGFAVGKNLEVTVTYDSFANNSNACTIPYTLSSYAADGGLEYPTIESGGKLTFAGTKDGAVSATFRNGDSVGQKDIRISIKSADWGRALAGEYSTTITFTSKVVNG